MARVAPAGPPAAGVTAGEVVLVIGVHRDELAFGDAVAERLGIDGVQVLRIPAGIDPPRTAPGEGFRSRMAHREMYLQLRQEVGSRARLLLDLHCAFDESRRGADVFCGDTGFLDALRPRLAEAGIAADVRLVRIAGDGDTDESPCLAPLETAHTWIPPDVWAAAPPRYVGIEIYRTAAGSGAPRDWDFANRLIVAIASCAVSRPKLP